MAIKMIVTDLDGTLLDQKKELTQRTVHAIIEAQKQGIYVVLATGRNYRSLAPIYRQLKMEHFNRGVIIGVNGEEIYYFDDQKYHKKRMLTPQECNQLLRFGNHLCFEVMIMNDDHIQDCMSKWLFFCKKIAYKIIHKVMTVNFEGQMNGHVFVSAKENITETANKVGYCQIPLFTKILLPYIHHKLDTHYEVLEVSSGWLEIMPKGISKGYGLQEVMEHYHIQKEEVLVFGDGENDISMLSLVDYSYAPQNALKRVKKAANYICDSHKSDGVAKIIEKYLNK